jgi:hypothetical protein
MKKSQLMSLVREAFDSISSLPSTPSQKTAGHQIIIDVPEDTHYSEFAGAVADYLKNEYGEHLVTDFLEALRAKL